MTIMALRHLSRRWWRRWDEKKQKVKPARARRDNLQSGWGRIWVVCGLLGFVRGGKSMALLLEDSAVPF
jgi:hypothetical protein